MKTFCGFVFFVTAVLLGSTSAHHLDGFYYGSGSGMVPVDCREYMPEREPVPAAVVTVPTTVYATHTVVTVETCVVTKTLTETQVVMSTETAVQTVTVTAAPAATTVLAPKACCNEAEAEVVDIKCRSH
ncbi:hypothetical protein GQ42DRAFT_158440 [Ramicandelaber brevisporus]|nr:hypothetical protein GQ42DRAFT_158440 [Ramicandelaber brevisporus]